MSGTDAPIVYHNPPIVSVWHDYESSRIRDLEFCVGLGPPVVSIWIVNVGLGPLCWVHWDLEKTHARGWEMQEVKANFLGFKEDFVV